VASFVCPPPSSSLPPTPPHLLGRRRRRRSTARCAPPSLPSSIAGDPPPSPGRPSFLLSRSRFTRAPPPLLRPSSGGTPDHLDLAGIELDRFRGAEVLLRRLTLLPGGEAPCAGGRPSLPRRPRTRGPAPAPAPALRRRSLPGGARGGPARARAPPRRWDLRPAAFTPHSGAPSRSGARGRSWRRRAGGAGCRARTATRRPSRRQQARAASTHGGEGAPASAQSKHAGPTVPPSSLSLLRPPRARPPQARSGGSCRATRALGAATGGLAHADGGERRRSEWRPVDERTRKRRTAALGAVTGGRAHSEG